jgi:2-iminoacetate synthase
MSFADEFRPGSPPASARLRRFSAMLAEGGPALEVLAREARQLTLRHFGRTLRLFAPLYLSNECVNNCRYCGFSRDNPILRVTLSPDQVAREAWHLHGQGFRNILLVAGEHPRFVSEGYLQECLRRLKGFIPTLAIEVGPMEDHQYREIVAAGAEGLVVYQETYNPEAYAALHTAGPKKDFRYRLECPERAYRAGLRRIGIGALFGLAEWRAEAVALATHLDFLQRHCWKAFFTVSFPRLRPHAGMEGFQPDPALHLGDRDFVRLLLAFRICFPDVGIVLSTREAPAFRDAVLPLGVTHLSAGSHTEPGGYTGQGSEDLHLTVKGKRVELAPAGRAGRATGQFDIADNRSAAEVARLCLRNGFEPVWKDWDEAILSAG